MIVRRAGWACGRGSAGGSHMGLIAAVSGRVPGGKTRPGTRRHVALEIVSCFDREAYWGIGTHR
jgi:hypothetical protein